MKEETKLKFNLIVDYHSDHEPSKKALYEISLYTDLEIETSGIIRMTIQILMDEFLEPNDPPKVYYNHQTLFELQKGKKLSEIELLDMFLFTEKRFMNTQLKDENGEVSTIQNLYPSFKGLDKDRLKEIVKKGENYIATLW